MRGTGLPQPAGAHADIATVQTKMMLRTNVFHDDHPTCEKAKRPELGHWPQRPLGAARRVIVDQTIRMIVRKLDNGPGAPRGASESSRILASWLGSEGSRTEIEETKRISFPMADPVEAVNP